MWQQRHRQKQQRHLKALESPTEPSEFRDVDQSMQYGDCFSPHKQPTNGSTHHTRVNGCLRHTIISGLRVRVLPLNLESALVHAVNET